jgi:3-oxoacyl-[acyl-carrier protein] reductase
MKIEIFDELININVRAPFLLTQSCLPYIPRGGRIILLSSISARHPISTVNVPLYAMTKGAIEALAREWAFEFGHSRGINVNGTSEHCKFGQERRLILHSGCARASCHRDPEYNA